MAFEIPNKLTKLQRLLSSYDIDREIDLLNKKLEKEIVKLNQNQIRFGRRSDNSVIQPPYAGLTIALKYKAGKLTNNNPNIVNLYDTGAFYAGFYVNVTSNEIIIDSTDSKTEDLKDKYQETIFGLNENNLQIVLEKIRTELTTNLKNKLNAL